MRINRTFLEYCKIQKEYEELGKELPDSIKNEYETLIFLEETYRTLVKYADGRAIPKRGWELINRICERKIQENLSYDTKEKLEKYIAEIMTLRNIFKEQEDLLIDGHTLTKKGLKTLRNFCDKIRKL